MDQAATMPPQRTSIAQLKKNKNQYRTNVLNTQKCFFLVNPMMILMRYKAGNYPDFTIGHFTPRHCLA